ncbi:MAG: hypothetical protein AAFO93_08955 [Pseudomonadota bacterium]
MKTAVVCVALVLATSGCARLAESSLNPMNLFNRDKAEQPREIRPLVPEQKVVRVVDARAVAQSLSALEITPVNSGALVRATGSMGTAGAYGAQLVTVGVEGSTLILALRAFTGGAGGSTVTVGRFLSNEELAGVRNIRVTSQTNALSRRRLGG